MARIEALTVPKWGMTMTEGTVVNWLVAEGAVIAKGDEVVEIETSKLTNVVEASASGTLRRIVLSEGETAPVGALAAVIADDSATDTELDEFVASYAARLGEAAGSGAGPATRSLTIDEAGVNILEDGLAGGPGNADLVVLLHGFGGDLTTWMFNQGDLAAGFRTVAIDLPGHGGSAPTRNDDAFEGSVAAALGVIEQLGAGRVHLVGHSFGGGIAAIVASRLGERAASLSLIAPIGLSGEMNGAFLTDFIAAERRRPMQKVLERLVADPGKITAEMVEGTLSFKRLEGVTEALAAIAATIAEGDRQRRDITDTLAGLSCPVLLIWGDQDAILPLPEKVPANAVLHRVTGAGHMPQMEASSSVNREIINAIKAAN